MMNKIYRYIAAAGLGLCTASCIENDIPYPQTPANILRIEAQGQIETAVINTSTLTVNLKVADTVDLSRVTITRANITENAVASERLDTVLDLSSPKQVTLSIYQDFVWTISASWAMTYDFAVANQIGETIIDTLGRRAIVYVASDQDLSNVIIEKLKIAPSVAVYTPSVNQLKDFRLRQTVRVEYYGKTEEWQLFVLPSAGGVSVPTVNAWTRVAWLKSTGKAGAGNGFEYAESNSSAWKPVGNVTENGGAFTARIAGLTPNTKYKVRAISDGQTSGEATFSTGTEQPLPNAGFENWFKNGKVWCVYAENEQRFWDTGNKGSATLNKNVTNYDENTVHGGERSAVLESQFVGIGAAGKFAAGNIFTGKYLETDGTNGILSFGQAFTACPTRLTGYYRYTPVPLTHVSDELPDLSKGDPDMAHIYIAIGDWSEPVEIRTKKSVRKLFDKDNDPNIIAYGELIQKDEVNEWTRFSIEFDYRSTSRVPTYIVIVATASRYGDFFTGGDGSTLWLDDFALEYDY